MIKGERTFASLETKEQEIKIGEPVVLIMENGDRIKTSPVQNWFNNLALHLFTVETRNTIYKMYY